MHNLLLLFALFLAPPINNRPMIEKRGTIECDIVEASPVVFDKRLYYFESVSADYKHKEAGVDDSYFRFWDVAEKKALPYFAKGYHLGSAMAVGDFMYVFGVEKKDKSRLHMFWTRDLIEWHQMPVIDFHGVQILNSSACRVGPKFVLAVEINNPKDESLRPFAIRFAESTDLRRWQLLSLDHSYARDIASACPTLRFVDGFYYLTYLKANEGGDFETHITRSKELVDWEASPLNPILRPSNDDRLIANPTLTHEEQSIIESARNVQNADVDFCDYQGETHILYSWGDHQGSRHLAEARFPAPLNTFLPSYFPAAK